MSMDQDKEVHNESGELGYVCTYIIVYVPGKQNVVAKSS